jgi:flavin reductase (DIM6/NTAB) family NADH-FMN oxidoreductase RutF
VTDEAITDAYERLTGPVDPPAVIVTCARGADRAGCLVTFNSPCSIDPPRYAVWLSHRNHTYRVALEAGELLVHLLTHADLPLAEYFGGVSGTREDKFARVPWTDRDGLPLLGGHGGWLRGRVLSRVPGREETGGDHTCFVLEPVAAEPPVTGATTGTATSPSAARLLRMSDLRHVDPGQPAGE